jgi:hypothetical protein
MEIKLTNTTKGGMTLLNLKAQTLALDKDAGVSYAELHRVTNLVRSFMSEDSAQILLNAIEKEDGDVYYFPNKGDAEATWKRMVRAYKAA